MSFVGFSMKTDRDIARAHCIDVDFAILGLLAHILMDSSSGDMQTLLTIFRNFHDVKKHRSHYSDDT